MKKKVVQKNNDTLYIVMPAYNEEDTITSVVESWYPILDMCDSNSKLIIADNNSKDNTYKILTDLQKKYSKLDVIKTTIKGHGPTVIALYKYAIENNADYIFQTDSDGQTNPLEFKKFWDKRNEYDVILGNREVRGDGKSRKFVENTLCFILRVFFGVKLKDANAPFRLMKSNVAKKYIDRFKEDYNLPNVMLSTYFMYYQEKLKYEVITFKPRQGGVNSIDIKKIVKIGIEALKDFNGFKKEMGYSILKGNKSLIIYLIFGVLTTVVNIISYAICAYGFSLSTMLSTTLAWIIAVLFAYITNRKWVFESKVSSFKCLVNEFISFVLCRLLTGLLDIGLMYLFVDKLLFNDIVIKVVVNVIVVVLNYIASKLLIFKRDN